MDKIILHDCQFLTTIGITEQEKGTPRALHIDIELYTDIRGAAAQDHISATVSYSDVHALIAPLVQQRTWDLIETVAQQVANQILAEFPLQGVLVRVRNPSALQDRQVAYTAVEIVRIKS